MRRTERLGVGPQSRWPGSFSAKRTTHPMKQHSLSFKRQHKMKKDVSASVHWTLSDRSVWMQFPRTPTEGDVWLHSPSESQVNGSSHFKLLSRALTGTLLKFASIDEGRETVDLDWKHTISFWNHCKEKKQSHSAPAHDHMRLCQNWMEKKSDSSPVLGCGPAHNPWQHLPYSSRRMLW